MQIDSIELFHVGLPMKQPLEIAGRPVDSLETVLVRMQSGEAAGWGEASPGGAPLAGAEWAAGVFACLRDWLAPLVAGTVVDTGDIIGQRLEAFRGNRFAKAALDTAWWDLEARLQGRPLHQLLDGRREGGLAFGICDVSTGGSGGHGPIVRHDPAPDRAAQSSAASSRWEIENSLRGTWPRQPDMWRVCPRTCQSGRKSFYNGWFSAWSTTSIHPGS